MSASGGGDPCVDDRPGKVRSANYERGTPKICLADVARNQASYALWMESEIPVTEPTSLNLLLRFTVRGGAHGWEQLGLHRRGEPRLKPARGPRAFDDQTVIEASVDEHPDQVCRVL